MNFIKCTPRKSETFNHEKPTIRGKNERMTAIRITVLPVNPRFSINQEEKSKPVIPPDPSDRLSSPIWIEKSVDDEMRRIKKDSTLITIKALSILLTAPCIKVMPADKKSRGKK